MRLTSYLIVAGAALALVACSSAPKTVNTGKVHGRTFSFVDRGVRLDPNSTDQRQVAHRLIQDAITRNLAARGVTRTGTGSDLTVAYLVIIGNNASTESVSDFFGDPEAAAALHEKAQDAYSSSKNPNRFEAGTLVIDIIDSRTYKLLKRGYTTSSILRGLPDQTKATRVQEAVDAILGDLQIVP